MKFEDYLNSGKQVISIVGATKVGKSTIAKEIQKMTGGQVWHARDFYREVIVPEYYRLSGNSPKEGQTFRDQTVEAADWWYSKDPAMMATLMLKHMEVTGEPVILESMRVLGDVKFFAKYKNVFFVVIEADDATRAKRLIKSSIDGQVTEENALKHLKFNDTHYDVLKTVEYAKSLPNHVAVTTSNLVNEIPSLDLLKAKLKTLTRLNNG